MKKKFVIQLILFLVFSLAIPCGYLIVKFHLFEPTQRMKIGFWGVIVIAIMLSVVSVLIKMYLDGLKTKYKWIKQVINGCVKLIFPLLLFFFVVNWLGDNVELLQKSLLIIIPSEFIAICVNPLPKWCFENNIEGMSEIVKKIRGGD